MPSHIVITADDTTTDDERLPPIHPGEILHEEFLRPMNVTQYRLAKAIGVDARRIHAIVHGERSITAETALLFPGTSATPPDSGWACKASMIWKQLKIGLLTN